MKTATHAITKEELYNTITHGIGAVMGLGVMIWFAILSISTGNVWYITSFCTFALCMFLLYSMSTIYHAITNADLKRFFRKLDHSAIYLLIAGTYTPFTLITLREEGIWGWLLFGFIWCAAIIGIIFSFLKMKKTSIVKTICYLLMGWVVVFAIKPLITVLGESGHMDVLYWLVAGGAFYTVGTVFYVLDKYKYMHSIWHLFVLGGTLCHVIAIANLV